MKGWIGIDLDGTLAEYEGWYGWQYIGPPIPRMVQRVKDLLDQGYTVKISTARVCDQENREEIISLIKMWCKIHIGQELDVTNVKDYGMVDLYDDRVHQVVLNMGLVVGEPYPYK